MTLKFNFCLNLKSIHHEKNRKSVRLKINSDAVGMDSWVLTTVKSILWGTLFLNQVHKFSFLWSNLVLNSFFIKISCWKKFWNKKSRSKFKLLNLLWRNPRHWKCHKIKTYFVLIPFWKSCSTTATLQSDSDVTNCFSKEKKMSEWLL